MLRLVTDRQLYQQVHDPPAVIQDTGEREAEIAVLMVFRRGTTQERLDLLKTVFDAPPPLVPQHHSPDLVSHFLFVLGVGLDQRVVRLEGHGA